MTIKRINVYEDKYAETATYAAARKNPWVVLAVGSGQSRSWRFPNRAEAVEFSSEMEADETKFWTPTGVLGREAV